MRSTNVSCQLDTNVELSSKRELNEELPTLERSMGSNQLWALPCLGWWIWDIYIVTQDKRGKVAKPCCNITLYFLFQFLLKVPSLELLKKRSMTCKFIQPLHCKFLLSMFNTSTSGKLKEKSVLRFGSLHY